MSLLEFLWHVWNFSRNAPVLAASFSSREFPVWEWHLIWMIVRDCRELMMRKFTEILPLSGEWSMLMVWTLRVDRLISFWSQNHWYQPEYIYFYIFFIYSNSLQSAFSLRLFEHGFNFYQMFVPDLMHEFELGVWKAIFTHCMRILHAHGNETISILNSRSVEFNNFCIWRLITLLGIETSLHLVVQLFVNFTTMHRPWKS